MNLIFRSLYFVGLSGLLSSIAVAQTTIEEIVVTSEFGDVQLLDTPNSVAVVGAADIRNRNARFLTEVLGEIPNLNYSSGASRGHFFQIRGIGERSQFIDPLNSGVGLLVDGIDYSTLGAAATLLDIDYVEVLRGPQGARFGANALAGIISMHSADPTLYFTGELSAGLGGTSGNEGSIDLWQTSAVLSGPLATNLSGRLAVQQNTSDGFVENLYLDRDNTQNIDELTLRAKLDWQASDRLNIDTTLLWLDIDNGYDSFTLDNRRETISDEPGEDNLESRAISVKSTYSLSETSSWITQLTRAESDSVYSYDEDWTNPDICTSNPCVGWEYMSFDEFLRDTQTNTLDSRLISDRGDSANSWVLGLYLKSQTQDLRRNYTYDSLFTSSFESSNLAAYGSSRWPIADNTHLSAGLRVESFDGDYQDNRGQDFSTEDTLLGGHLSLEHDLTQDRMIYGRLARGYKSGGVNGAGAASLPGNELRYDAEILWNYELGLKGLGQAVSYDYQIALFYQDRKDAQVKQSFVECDPTCSFTDYVDNAAEAHSYGLEAELNWNPATNWLVGLSLGLLQTKFDEYFSTSHVGATPTEPYDMSGEELAQSPEYQVSLSSEIGLTDRLSLWVSVDTKDSFRFSNRHLAESEAHALLNANLSWQGEKTRLTLWGSNLTNEDYTTRGFGSFNNDPRDFYTPPEDYVQFGDPRQVGITLSHDLN